MKKNYDCAVIGIGRVGLPLSISMASKGINVIGIDINEQVIDSVNNKIFPFKEEGYAKLIKEVNFFASSDYSLIQKSKHIIITVGTPLMGHIETDLSYIISVLNSILPFLKKGHHLILRSTIAPNTSVFVKDFIEQNKNFKLGKDFYMSFCPERMAEGKSLRELETLPQIIGTIDTKSKAVSENFFKKFVPEILHTNFISAELIKLFNNISRYVYFATANQFAIIAEQYGANIHDIIDMSNYKYPRGVIPKPGLTAGTCLRKDFGMINENIPFTDLLLSAWKVNEFMPKFLIDGLKKRGNLKGKNISVLGYTF
ncbi:MAG: nucleotide sugar dehydrogenase, partial [Bacteroidota bacterium]|nr:nucleotide sugar dehydrogenase [Bacteroidota bacterium]